MNVGVVGLTEGFSQPNDRAKLSKVKSADESGFSSMLAGAAAASSQGALTPVTIKPQHDDQLIGDTDEIIMGDSGDLRGGTIDKALLGQSPKEDIHADLQPGSMTAFLEQMKREFGIDPDKVIKAFARIDQDKINEDPNGSILDVLKTLGLKPDQITKAEVIYKKLLKETGDSALKDSLGGTWEKVEFQVISEKEIANESLEKSIANLNDKFALRKNEHQAKSDSVVVQPKPDLSHLDFEKALLKKQEPVSEAPSAAQSMPLNAQILSEVINEAVSKTGSTKETKVNKKTVLGTAQLGAGAQPGLNLDGINQKIGEIKESSNSDLFYSDTENSQKWTGAESNTQTTGVFSQTGNNSVSGNGNSPSVFVIPAESAEMTKENAKDVVRNARLLLQGGGGEMKMQLKPEGVGDIHLKVHVKDGLVSVQMTTQSDSMKRLLENGLDELKASLAANRLHIDALKIEVGTEMAKQQFDQAQQEAAREQARGFAQDFMGQFRQDREAFRQGFFDDFGARSYKRSNRPTPPEMDNVAAMGSERPRNSGSNTQRLNLVA